MDRLDRLILQALQRNGRTPFTQIAKGAGVSETTIRARYRRLVAQGIVRPESIFDPRALGYEAPAIVALSTEPGTGDQVAKAICRLAEVSYLVTTLGPYDLIVELFCRDLPHLTDVVTQRIQPLPGVRATETLMIAESYADRATWFPGLEPETNAGGG